MYGNNDAMYDPATEDPFAAPRFYENEMDYALAELPFEVVCAPDFDVYDVFVTRDAR